MRIYLLLCTSFLLAASCSKVNRGKVNGEKYTISPVDSSKNTIIQTSKFTGVVFENATGNQRYKNFKSFTPTPEQVFKAEEILKRCVEVDKIGSDSMEIWPGSIFALDKYYRQYFGLINEKDQKVIWINCFKKANTKELSIPQKWKLKRAAVEDGYKNYFNIYTNITTEECYGFFRNSIGG